MKKKIIINEGQLKKVISAIRKDKKAEIFNYNDLTDSAWSELVADARDIQRISFDLENNDSTGQKKTFHVKKNLRENQPIKYTFNAEMMMAGGDWEMPVMYFRLEFTRQYFYGKLKKTENPQYTFEVDRSRVKLHKCYVVIPPTEAGNKLVNHTGEGSRGSKTYDWHAYQNDELSKEQEKEARITDSDKLSAWGWIEDLLANLVETHHETLD